MSTLKGGLDKSLEPTPVGRYSSAFAVDIPGPAWLSSRLVHLNTRIPIIMKTKVLRTIRLSVFFAFCATLLGGCTWTKTTGHREALQITAPSPAKAKVVFFRGGGHRWGIFSIHDGDRLIGSLSYYTYFAYECEPGDHLFSTALENVAMLDADLLPGRVYYVEVLEKAGWVMPAVEMHPIYPGCKGNKWDKLPKWLKSGQESFVDSSDNERDQKEIANYMARIQKYRQDEYLKNPSREQILPEYGQFKPVGTTE